MVYFSPLRYPGGKRRLTDTVTRLLDENALYDIEYAEPYAGGASIGLALLLSEYASVIHLNDLSRPVYAFWHTAISHPEWLCKRVENVRVTMRVWRRQRNIFDRADSANLDELGFATLFLNRTNRSGILRGGVIGGKNQDGKWLLDARFGRKNLIERIRRVARYKNRIELYQNDALDFINKVVAKLGKQAFAFIDPPYIDSGQLLYMNNYGIRDHEKIAARVSRLRTPWVVTYDRAAIGRGLYESCRRVVYDLHYVTNDRYLGREVMFVSDKLALPPLPALMGPCMHLVRHQSRLQVA